MKIELLIRDEKLSKLIEKYPPKAANKFLPDWYKKIKITKSRQDTEFYFKSGNNHAKKCPAIRNVINEGIIIPAWSDIYFRWDVDTFEYDMPIRKATEVPIKNYLEPHNSFQTEHMDLNIEGRVGALKLTSPYYFKVSEGYSLYFSDPFYMFRKNIRFLPGIVESDYWHETNFPFEFYNEIKGKGSFIVKAGDPLVHIVPIKRRTEKDNIIVRSMTPGEEKEIEYQKINRFHQDNWKSIYEY